jgi:hypothetical protein
MMSGIIRSKILVVFLLLGTCAPKSLLADWESILKNASRSEEVQSNSAENENPKIKRSKSSKLTASESHSQTQSFVPKYKVPQIEAKQGEGDDPSKASMPPGQPKEALLIANGDYAHFAKLPNPTGDAKTLVASLQVIGFHITLVENATREGMLDALQSFQDRLKKSHAVALFHYGGHGVQVDGRNYLIPTEVDIPDERKVATRAVDLDEVMTTLDASGSIANVVILDACRDNPLPATLTRSTTRGLTVVQTKPKNSLVIFAAEAGSRAQDGLFTPTLARAITKPGKSLSQIMKEVRKDVFNKSNGTQTPGEYDQLFEDIYLYSQPNIQQGGPTPSSATSVVTQSAVGTTNSVAESTNSSNN